MRGTLKVAQSTRILFQGAVMSQPEESRANDGKGHSRLRRWDVAVLLLLLIVGVGLLLPAVPRIRVGGYNPGKCLNNLRQIGLAVQSANVMHARLPPFFGVYEDKPAPVQTANGALPHPATIYFHLLPHLEEVGVYQRLPPLFDYPATNQYVIAPDAPLGGAADENAAMFRVPVYLCPSDISADASGVELLSLSPDASRSPWGLNNYSANYLLFGMVKNPRLPESVPDGLSTTIFFAEKAGICADPATGRKGGNIWAAPAFFPFDPQGQVNYGGTLGYDPGINNPTKPFALGLFQSIVPEAPCDPTLAQAPHKSGINVSMGDGSARTISLNVSPTTWSALLTPYPIPGQTRSDKPGEDW
jgi:hypothetical protein